MNKRFLFIILIGLMFLLVSCVPGPNPYVKTADENGKVAGFWSGLWHGIISPITFFISLFTDDVSVYDVHNNGNWYDFGFVLGAGIILGGSGSSSSRRN